MAEKRIDAFLSYNERERSLVSPIANWLTTHGVGTHFWGRDVRVGEPISEQEQLQAARTVVVFLGAAGWGKTHIQQAAYAAERDAPVLPVLIGAPSDEDLAAAGGLFRDRRYIDLRQLDEEKLEQLRRQILSYTGDAPEQSREETVVLQSAGPVDARAEHLFRMLIDGSDDERHKALAEVARGRGFHRGAFARRLREFIDGPYGVTAQANFAAAPRDTQKIGSIRSWMLSALLLTDPESEATRVCVTKHITSFEPDRNVRFWTLAGVFSMRTSYLNEALEIASSDASEEVSSLAAAIMRSESGIARLRAKIQSGKFETIWHALRALRVVPVEELLPDVCDQLLKSADGTALAYDVLYAVSHPAVAARAASIILERIGFAPLMNVTLDVGAQSNRAAIKAFTYLLAKLDQRRVRLALSERQNDSKHTEVVRLIWIFLDEFEPSAVSSSVSRAGFVSDTVAGQTDQLDIDEEVRTFAAIMVARDVDPPLAIGLFGDWGSGKSFFMNALQSVVDKLAARSKESSGSRRSQFCSDVVQIRFNAWHYVDSNLWASLVTFILQKLAEYVSPEPSVEQKHAALLSELASAKALTAEAEAERKRAKELLDKDEKELHRVRGERQTKEIELADLRATDVAALLMNNPEVQKEITSALKAVGVSEAINSQEDLRRAVEEARQTRNSALELLTSMVQQKYWPLYVVALVGAPLIVYLLQRYAYSVEQVVAAVSALVVEVAAVITTAALWIRRGTEVVRQNLAKVETAKAHVDELIAKRRSEVSVAEQALSDEVEKLKVSEQRAAARLSAASQHVVEVEARLKAFKETSSVARFLAERTGSDDYRKHLGLISLVRRDFEALSERLANQTLFGDAHRPVERIVLYIDDLDRCPAEKVVEVLQAVHLLLAYRLFVVVVGVDSRWLLSSLASHYAEFRGSRRRVTTPQHYLEKIFQIPYSLRPMNQRGYSRLINHVMSSARRGKGSGAGSAIEKRPAQMPEELGDGVGDAPLLAPEFAVAEANVSALASTPTRTNTLGGVDIAAKADDMLILEDALVIQPWEIAFAQSLHRLIPSPRAVKRLSNTYRILKARVRAERVSRFEGTVESPGDFQVPLLLLALLIKSPEVAAEWFPALLLDAPGYGSIEEALLQSLDGRRGGASTLSECLRPLVSASTFPQDVDLLTEWLPQVARFSFDLGGHGR